MQPRALVLVAVGCLSIGALGVGVSGCGASEPRESDVFHDPALRAGVVPPATEGDRGLLQRLASDPTPGSVEVAGQTYVIEDAYAAASGRACRAITGGGGRRLACETGDGWQFVPEVLGGQD